jgi:kynureninase
MKNDAVLTNGLQTPAEVLTFRKQFPIFETQVHLANNSKGALSHSVMAAHQEYLDTWLHQGAPWGIWVGKHEALRAAFAKLIGAGIHEVAVCPSATLGLATVASCFDYKKRPALAFDDFSFPSVTYLWHAQAMRGADIRRVHANDNNEIPVEAFDHVFDDRLQFLSVAHVCYKNGHRMDLPSLASRCHDVGALFVVDDYQSCGSRPLNVKEADIDVLITGTVKFLLGSAGVALLYVREDLLDELHPTITGWFGQNNPDDFQVERHVEAKDATRFQNGTPAIPSVYDSLAGLALVETVGLEAIGRWIDSLTALLIARLQEEGFIPATPLDPAKRGPQVAIRSTDAVRAVAELARRNVVATSRDNNVRVAFHYYNTPGDIEALIQAFKEIKGVMLQKR